MQRLLRASSALRSRAASLLPYATARPKEEYTAVHFRMTPTPHPLKKATWKNPTPNHVWSDEELRETLSPPQPHLKPTHIVDYITYGMVRTAYSTFNFISGYNSQDPTPRSVERRLLFLESIAGVPGMVAAAMRHFRSLRTMRRDHGWIHTLLEEAENERMHLLVFMKMFSPGPTIRLLVIVAQGVLVTLLTGTYAVYPKALHRFVGYLEEFAVQTYTEIIALIQTPGSQLHTAWKDLPAPEIAKAYWRLSDDARFLDVVRQVAADETHHRDVNHTFASLSLDTANPYILQTLDNAAAAWRTSLPEVAVDAH